MIDTYAIITVTDNHIEGYAVVHPETGALVSNLSFENGYCERPVTLDLVDAQVKALQLSQETGIPWEVKLAPGPCPSCGRVIWADDYDFLYPENRARTSWRAGCNHHDFGCGFKLKGPSALDVLERWNHTKPFRHETA